MAIKILASPIHGTGDPAIDVKDPLFIAEKEKRVANRHDPLRDPVEWTIPQISNATTPPMVPDMSQPVDPATGLYPMIPAPADAGVPLEMGVVYEVRAKVAHFIQNISENEDDKLEFSRHGNPEGIWGRLNAGSMVKFEGKSVFTKQNPHGKHEGRLHRGAIRWLYSKEQQT